MTKIIGCKWHKRCWWLASLLVPLYLDHSLNRKWNSIQKHLIIITVWAVFTLLSRGPQTDQSGLFCSRFGRKRAAQVPVILMVIFTVTTGVCPNFSLYLASQFMVGLGYGGYRLNGIILGTVYSYVVLFVIIVNPFISLLIKLTSTYLYSSTTSQWSERNISS